MTMQKASVVRLLIGFAGNIQLARCSANQ